MSYHDGFDPQRLEGISVVNPLREIQQKLDKIANLLNEIGLEENQNLSATALRGYMSLIQNILNDVDEKPLKIVK